MGGAIDTAPGSISIVRGAASSSAARSLTQQDLADRLGVTARTIAAFESGRENLTLRTMFTIARALGVDAAELLVPPSSTAAPRGRPRKEAPAPARATGRAKKARG